MDILLLGIYSFFVWLIFIKFKWLPWNITSQVIVVIIPIVALTVMILTLNVVAPSSAKLRVFKYTIPIVSQVRGRVLEVPVEEGNRLVHKGDVLFRVDPTPYQLDVDNLEAQLALAQGGQRETEETLTGANAKVAEARAAIAQATARISRGRCAARARAKARRAEPGAREVRRRQSLRPGAGRGEPGGADRPARIGAQPAGRGAGDARRRRWPRSGRSSRSWARTSMARTRKSRRSERNSPTPAGCSIRRPRVSPCDCYVINLQLRPGAFVAGLPLNPVMSLVEADGQVIAFYSQNELIKVAARTTRRSSRSTLTRAASSKARSTRSSGPSVRARCSRPGRSRCRRSPTSRRDNSR